MAEEVPEDERRAQYVPAKVKGFWNLTAGMVQNLRTEQKARLKEQYKEAGSLVAEFQRQEIGILAGTDSPMIPNVVSRFSLHDELTLMVEGGLTPLEALQTATLNPARFLGKLDDPGTIEKGKLADLVILDANPLEDIHNTTKINAVIAQGKLLDRTDLDRPMREALEMAKSSESAAQTRWWPYLHTDTLQKIQAVSRERGLALIVHATTLIVGGRRSMFMLTSLPTTLRRADFGSPYVFWTKANGNQPSGNSPQDGPPAQHP